ncbi:hypothetical protein OHB26_16315 [Nocardia sp. NBC_01503]|uniref:hypothetical protein n=1 Tax=Nocardia sp. NBC_01503 TaxID=2975997 RepID=UPI002E7C063D|nr:hypothetical protein [Nocardia sp. NBC_01503]WTL35615.1 hypothetical protein OHB26_16315 [Nocardia sp. NBC_01503]
MAFKDRLPTGSHYRSAVLMDYELAEERLDAEEQLGEDHEEDVPSGPRPEGYTLDTYMLMAIIDALNGVQATIIAAAGSDPPTVRPLPRPLSAVEIVREERRAGSMQALIDMFTAPPVPDTPEVLVTEADEDWSW